MFPYYSTFVFMNEELNNDFDSTIDWSISVRPVIFHF